MHNSLAVEEYRTRANLHLAGEERVDQLLRRVEGLLDHELVEGCRQAQRGDLEDRVHAVICTSIQHIYWYACMYICIYTCLYLYYGVICTSIQHIYWYACVYICIYTCLYLYYINLITSSLKAVARRSRETCGMGYTGSFIHV